MAWVGWPTRLPGRASARSAHQVVVRGATSLALVWQALWLAGDPSLWPWRQASIQDVAMWVVVASWAALLCTQAVGGRTVRRVARRAAVLALLVAATLDLVAVGSGEATWSTASNLAALAAGVAGLLLDLRPAIAAVGLVVVVATATAATVGSSPTDLLYPGFALAVGVASVAARATLVRQARAADAAASASIRLEAERRVHEGVEAALRQQERALHATVLNTLTAIERGGLTGAPRARLSARCREAARVLRDLYRDSGAGASPAHALERDLEHAVDDLRAAGTEVTLDIDEMTALPTEVYLAVRAAVQEALSNVLRHAQAARCAVRARVVTAAGSGRVEVMVEDDGRGFDTRGDLTRFGLGEAITGPMREIGGRATVESADGRGTRVRLYWHGDLGAGADRPYRPSAAAMAVPILSAFGLFALASMVATVGQVGQPVFDVLALAVLFAVYGLIMMASRRGWLPVWLVVVVVGGGAIAYELQQRAETGGGAWADWSSVAVAIAFFVVAGAGPRWAWIAVVAAWLVLQGDIVAELVSPGTAVLIAGALFGRSTRRNAAVVDAARTAERAQVLALAVADASLRRLQARYAALAESDVVALLDDVAEGRLTPDDPRVRHRAAVEERFVRSLIRIDPQADPLRAVVGEVVRTARAQSVALACDVGDVPLRGIEDLPALRTTLLAAMTMIGPTGEGRLTARREEQDVVVRLFAVVGSEYVDAAAALAVPGLPVEQAGDIGQPTLWEWRTPAEQR